MGKPCIGKYSFLCALSFNVSTIFSGIIGTLLAMGMELRKTNAYVEGIAFIPMIIPDIVMAISLLSFFTLPK